MTSTIVPTQQKLRRRAEDVKPFLELEEPFTIDDVETDQERVFDVLKLMNKNGAIKKVGHKRADNNYIGKWKWVEKEKEELKEYLEDRDEFPCGHSISIFNPKWADELACKECHREYTKEQVKQWL